MNRGEVWWVNFDPSVGGEIKKKRPAIIISNNAANKFLNRVQVIPLTSNTEKLYSSEAFVTIRRKKSKAMADQMTTVSKIRVVEKYGAVSEKELKNVEKALCIHLGLKPGRN